MKIAKFILLLLFYLPLGISCDRYEETEDMPEYSKIEEQEGTQSLEASTESKPLINDKDLKNLSANDVFFVSRNNFPAYEDESFHESICKLAFGKQFLISEETEFFLKIRLDRIAYNTDSCIGEQKFAYIDKQDLDLIGEISENLTLTTETPIYLAGEEDSFCTLQANEELLVVERLSLTYTAIQVIDGMCANGFSGTAIIKDSSKLPLNERFHRTNKLVPHILTDDLKVYANVEKNSEPLCILAKNLSILVSPDNEIIQLPLSSQCDKRFSEGFFLYTPGIWLEDQLN